MTMDEKISLENDRHKEKIEELFKLIDREYELYFKNMEEIRKEERERVFNTSTTAKVDGAEMTEEQTRKIEEQVEELKKADAKMKENGININLGSTEVFGAGLYEKQEQPQPTPQEQQQPTPLEQPTPFDFMHTGSTEVIGGELYAKRKKTQPVQPAPLAMMDFKEQIRNVESKGGMSPEEGIRFSNTPTSTEVFGSGVYAKQEQPTPQEQQQQSTPQEQQEQSTPVTQQEQQQQSTPVTQQEQQQQSTPQEQQEQSTPVTQQEQPTPFDFMHLGSTEMFGGVLYAPPTPQPEGVIINPEFSEEFTSTVPEIRRR